MNDELFIKWRIHHSRANNNRMAATWRFIYFCAPTLEFLEQWKIWIVNGISNEHPCGIIQNHRFTCIYVIESDRQFAVDWKLFRLRTSKWSGARNVYTATEKANRKARTNINFTFLSSKISCKRGFYFFPYHRLLRRWKKFKTVFELSENLC